MKNQSNKSKGLHKFRSENKRIKGRINGNVPYGFSFGSMGPRREWPDNRTQEEVMDGMKQYMPHPTSQVAKLLKLAKELKGIPRCAFFDSAQFSNVAQNKAGLLKYNKRTKKYHLTDRGQYYVKTRNIELDIELFLMEQSQIRYINNDLQKALLVLSIGYGGKYDNYESFFDSLKKYLKRKKQERRIFNLRQWINRYKDALNRYRKPEVIQDKNGDEYDSYPWISDLRRRIAKYPLKMVLKYWNTVDGNGYNLSELLG